MEALVDTAIAVGTASVLGKLSGRGGEDDVSEQMVVNAAIQMENQVRACAIFAALRSSLTPLRSLQVKNGLIKMKEKYILDNVRHVFHNVPSSIASTGRRFSWSQGGKRTSHQELELMRAKIREAEQTL